MKKGFTLIEVLSVIVILSVICAIAYPKIIDVIESSRISAYNSAKGNIIESAKLKYLADINNAKITEYTVDDLIASGYLSKNTKNPITSKNYENTKVVITNDNGKVSYSYIDSKTLYDVISKKDGIYKNNEDYIFKGSNAYNYISFNEEIYRILKIDELRNVYIIKDEDKTTINKNNIDEYITSYYNDNYAQEIKSKIISFEVLDYEDYINSYIKDDTFIINNNDIWVKYLDEYKSLSYIKNELNNKENANIRLVLKLKNDITIIGGEGTQLNPYLIK